MAPRHFTVLLESASLLILALPMTAYAQTSNGPVTRTQVLQHLYDLEDVGYRPARASSLRFPYDIEAAEERLAEKKQEEASRADSVTPSDSSGNRQDASAAAR